MHIAVVGGGIIGLACAYELSLDGHHITVLEADEPGHGASAGSAAKVALAECAPVPAPGMVVQGLKWMLNPASPLYIRPSLQPEFARFMISMARHCNSADFRRGLQTNLALASQSLAIMDEWKQAGMVYEEHSKGILLVFEHQRSFENHLAHEALFAKHGYVPEVLSSHALHDREPCLSDRIRFGLFYSADRQIEPVSLTDALTLALEKSGQLVYSRRKVTGFGVDKSRVRSVLAGGEELECDAVVVAAGVHCGPLTTKLGAAMPVRAGKGYSVDYPDPPTALQTPLTFEDAHVAVTPLDSGLRLAGTMEFTGIETTIRPRRVEAIKRAAELGFADWHPGKAHRAAWAGLRPMTPDGLPIVGYLPGYDNALIASGHGMLGLTLAPTTARSITSLVRGDRPDSDLQAVSPNRFSRRRIR